MRLHSGALGVEVEGACQQARGRQLEGDCSLIGAGTGVFVILSCTLCEMMLDDV